MAGERGSLVDERTLTRFADSGIVLPTFEQLADPTTIPADVRE